MKTDTLFFVKAVMVLSLMLCIMTWFGTRDIRTQWLNVPPVPSEFKAVGMGLGDKQFSHRAIGIMLQNFGNTGGRFIPLKDYNYERLADWLRLQQKLDPTSNFTPFLASYYFGATQNPEALRPIINYLAIAGEKTEGEKWRWLAHAVYLSRFKLKDNKLALELAYKLAAIPNEDMPVWARQLPANILKDRGEKEAAMELILNILSESGDKLHPNEVNALNDYMCRQILDEEDAKRHDFCNNIP